MGGWLLLWLLLAASPALCQGCTVYLVVDAFDRTTHLSINGLRAADFEAKAENDTLQIVDAVQPFTSRVLVMVQGAEGTDGPNVPKVAQRVAEMARQAPAGQPLAFALYGERAIFTNDFSKDVEQRAAAIDRVLAQTDLVGRYPAAYDALHEGIQFFGQPQPGDTIVLVGSGHDVKSKRNDRDLEKELSTHHVRLLATVFTKSGLEGLNTQRERKYEEVFAWHGLASSTGGAYTHGISPTLIDFAWGGYLLAIKLPAPSEKTRDWKLQLRDAAAKAHKDALLLHPFKLPPCG